MNINYGIAIAQTQTLWKAPFLLQTNSKNNENKAPKKDIFPQKI